MLNRFPFGHENDAGSSLCEDLQVSVVVVRVFLGVLVFPIEKRLLRCAQDDSKGRSVSSFFAGPRAVVKRKESSASPE